MSLLGSSSRTPVFRKLGGQYQLIVERPEDLEHLWTLDEARWIATSVPVEGLNCDPAFPRFVDTDGDGYIRPDELRAACRWTLDLLADRSDLGRPETRLRLDAIDTSREEGRQLRATAERILENLGLEGAGEIRLEQVRDRQRILAAAATNGDGVIPPGAVEDPELAAFVADVGRVEGMVPDAGGKPGVTGAHLDAFLEHAAAWLAWKQRGSLAPGQERSEVLPRGERTDEAWAALEAVRAKLDEYFVLCGLVPLEGRLASEHQPLGEERLRALLLGEERPAPELLRRAPLARPRADGLLDPGDWVNPAWRDELRAFWELVLPPEARGEPLDPERWKAVQAEFEPYARWLASEEGAEVAALGVEKLRRYTGDPRYAEGLRAMIAADREVAVEVQRVAEVERLILYQRWLLELVDNSVNFTRFYDPELRSLAEMGTLVMDGRRFNLCFRVRDREAHKQRAQASRIFLLYVRLQGAPGSEPFEVAVAVTSAVRGSLHPGKRGIFLTTDGRSWDAEVVDILENPISLWEATKRPFLRLGGFVAEQVEKLTRSSYQQLEGTVGEKLSATESSLKELPRAVETPAPTEPAPRTSPRDALVGGGIAVAAMSSALAYIANTLASIDLVQLVVAVLILLFLTLIPTTLVAVLRLGRQDLGRVLEAGGWAINHRLPIRGNRGLVFTWRPPLPAGARRLRGDLLDAFKRRVAHEDEERKQVELWALAFLLLFLALALWGAWPSLLELLAG